MKIDVDCIVDNHEDDCEQIECNIQVVQAGVFEIVDELHEDDDGGDGEDDVADGEYFGE